MKKVLSMMLAVLLLFTVSAFADGTDTVAWGEYGRVQMTEVTEWNDGMSYNAAAVIACCHTTSIVAIGNDSAAIRTSNNATATIVLVV